MSGIDWTSQWEYETKLELEMFKKAGVISDYTYVVAQNDAAKQISDIEDLLAKGFGVVKDVHYRYHKCPAG